MGGNQRMEYDPQTEQLYHKVRKTCLDCDPATGAVFMNPCKADSKTQKWVWQHLNETLLEERQKKVAKEF